MEKRAKYENLDDNTKKNVSGLEKFNVDKSTEN